MMDETSRGPRNGAAGIRYSVILCTRNRAAFAGDCLRSILKNREPAYEVLVVDQSDDTSTEEVVAQQAKASSVRVRYIHDDRRGLSHANNLGIAMAEGEFLLFTHDDVFVAPDWVQAYEGNLKTLGVDSRAVITGRVEPGEPESGGVLAPSINTDVTGREYQGRHREGLLFPNNMLVHRSVFDVVGYFDPDLGPGTPMPAAEDNDFCYRVLINGYSIFYAPDAVALHRSWRTPEQMLALEYEYALGQGGFYAKHLWRRDSFLARAFVVDVSKTLVKTLIRRGKRRTESWNKLAGLIAGAAIMSWTIARQSLQGQRPAQPPPRSPLAGTDVPPAPAARAGSPHALV